MNQRFFLKAGTGWSGAPVCFAAAMDMNKAS
jgi:hypothetical protein